MFLNISIGDSPTINKKTAVNRIFNVRFFSCHRLMINDDHLLILEIKLETCRANMKIEYNGYASAISAPAHQTISVRRPTDFTST